MEVAECGAAALGIILGYYGRHVPLSELRRDCGVSRDGSQALNIVKAARRYGLTARAFRVELDGIRDVSCPYIVFWNFNHFLVVEGFSGDHVFLNDPASGPRTVTWSEFSESFTGLLLHLEQGPEFQRGGRRPRAVMALVRRLRGSIGVIAYCIAMGFLLVLPGLAIPVFSQVFVDEVLVRRMSDWLRPLLVGMLTAAALRGGFSWVQLRLLRALQAKLAVVFSSTFLWHTLRLPAGFYTQRYAGEIAGRVELNDKVAEVLSGRLATNAIDLVMVFAYAAVMLGYDVTLACIGIAAAIANLATLQLVSRARVDANARLTLEYGKVGAVSIAGLQGIETLKASGLEADFFNRWSGTYAKAVNAQQELTIATQRLAVVPSFLSALTSVLILAVGGVRVMNGAFSIGVLVAFQSLMQSFLRPVTNLVNLGSTIQELHGDLGRLDDVLEEAVDPQVQDREGEERAVTAPRLSGHLELREVTFGYNRLSPPLIDRFNVRLEPGRRVAIVGASGSGKSTLARLIVGLYAPWEGDILFDGLPRDSHPRAVLSASVAMVQQDVFLVEGSVRDNLTLWDRSIPRTDLVRACRDAEIYDAIMSLPGGFDAELAEGATNLSGGQRQRLEIARALARNPSILVLDEATSALDAETEYLIDQNLRRRGCSCVLIAHRLSTIRDCDEIIVLHEGKIAERGTHSRLVDAGGFYANLISVEGDSLTTAEPAAQSEP